MRIRHFGNTANNAYFNALLMREFEGIESDLPIRMFGLEHAISAPAWEALDFEVPDADWVPHPDWSSIPGAIELDSEYTDLPVHRASGETGASRLDPRAAVMSVARSVLQTLHGRPWAQPIFDLSYRWVLSRTSVDPQPADRVDVLYGADSLIKKRVPQAGSPFVCLEHGTVRWIADGGRELAVFRRAYREQVQRARHLWVTNLDPRTLEIAEEVAPGRWSALPHPYVPDPRVPFSESPDRRAELQRVTDSESIVLLPSSQNWAKHHDKKGVASHVAWVPPMARVSLQRMMADVDVVWDQFGLEAFGGLALRVMEQGAPMISRGLAPAGEQLIGGPVPWRHAAHTHDVVLETMALLDEIAARGRDQVMSEYRARGRAWLLERHSPRITARLQHEVYSGILDGTWQPGSAAPDRWAALLNEGLTTARDEGSDNRGEDR
jgi:hypothetical protein